MLQPALNTPALNTPTQVAAQSPATYGAFMASARDALDHAIAVSNVRQPSAEAAAEELRGYERFLNNAGNHLLLLTELAELRTDAVRHLARRLHNMGFRDATAGAWFDAATIIGAAHDLVASHVVGGVPRTLEAKQRLLGPGSAAACRDLTEMIIAAADASRELIHRARLAQKRRADRPISKATFYRLHLTNQAVSLSARATLWDLAEIPANLAEPLHTLQIALPADLSRSSTIPVRTPLAALRLLGQLCHDQARGLTSASPASLRDLAHLAVRVNDPVLLEPTDDERPLDRLQRAHAADQIDAARSAWATATTELTTTVQGITKAPGTYGAAAQALLNDPLDPRTRTALATALPSLGRDAARTVEALADRGDLVTLQPIPLQPRNAWRPITPEHGEAIATRFNAAADASSRAVAAIKDLQRTTADQRRSGAGQAQQRRLPQVEQARGVTS